MVGALRMTASLTMQVVVALRNGWLATYCMLML